MNFGKKSVFPPVGACIYCGRSDRQLTIEHIVPEGIGGNWMLPEASCRDCAATINRRIEQPFMRTIYGPLRLILETRSKRPKKRRPERLTLQISDSARKWSTAEVPVTYYPKSAIFPRFLSRPSAITGEVGANLTEIPHFLYKKDSFKRYGDRVGASQISVSRRMNITIVMLQLGKIAHCFAVSQLGYGGFRPVLPDIIRGALPDARITEFVGGSSLRGSLINRSDHFIVLATNGEAFAAHICLFAGLGAPVYEVLVGYR